MGALRDGPPPHQDFIPNLTPPRLHGIYRSLAKPTDWSAIMASERALRVTREFQARDTVSEESDETIAQVHTSFTDTEKGHYYQRLTGSRGKIIRFRE